jgi:hypothetical protein
VAARRNEKLANRNPARIQKQIDDLKQITATGGKLSKHEESVLEGLERDLKAVVKAREALGDRAPTFGHSGPRHDGKDGGVLGKRRRGREDVSSSDEDIPEDVKSIPMPRDTPPPIPREIMDQWYAKRRAARNPDQPSNANNTPLGDRPGRPRQQQEKTPAPVEVKTVYEAKPAVRDLRKEAVSAFVPTNVQMKLNKVKGQGGLIESEEADRLEKEGYLKGAQETNAQATPTARSQQATVEEAEDEDDQS